MHRTGQRPPERAIGPAGYSSYTVARRGFGPARDRTHRSTGTCGPSQSERIQAGRPPLPIGLLHRTGPPQDRAIGPAGHYTAVTVPGGIMIRLTEALTRAGRPSQDDFKLGGPRCYSSCTVPGCSHRTGRLGQRSNIQSVTVVVTVRGVCSEQDRIHRITGACGPGVPVHDMPVYVYHLVYVNIYMNLLTSMDIYIWISCSRCGYILENI